MNRIGRYNLALSFLTGMSLWFYGYFNPSYLLIIVISIIGNYMLSSFLDKKEQSLAPNQLIAIRRFILIAGVLLNLGILFYYKYYDFFIENINTVFRLSFNLKHILLPLGISFFTFQQLSYIVDRARGQAEHYSIIEYSAFVTFFPQLVAGPIVLHSELIPQLQDRSLRCFDPDKFYDGVAYFLIGLGKKVLLADMLARIANYGFDHDIYLDTVAVITVLISYSLELYFDFSGYSDMAIGLGLMFGVKLPINFNSPYKSTSLKQLWSKWHMTLTRFMTTYVYIPLGGSRKGQIRTLINVGIVFLLSGLWHGAAWTYVLWGALTGLIVIWDNLRIVGVENPKENKPLITIPGWLGVIFTNIAFTALLIPFRSTSLEQAAIICKDFTVGVTGNIYNVATGTMNIPEIAVLKQVVTRLLPQYERLMYVVVMYILILIGVAVVTAKNTPLIIREHRGKLMFNIALLLILVYSVISFSQVSTFIYFNF